MDWTVSGSWGLSQGPLVLHATCSWNSPLAVVFRYLIFASSIGARLSCQCTMYQVRPVSDIALWSLWFSLFHLRSLLCRCYRFSSLRLSLWLTMGSKNHLGKELFYDLGQVLGNAPAKSQRWHNPCSTYLMLDHIISAKGRLRALCTI